MSEFEYLVWRFIGNHARCTLADILGNFENKPELSDLRKALMALNHYDLIYKVKNYASSSKNPLRAYYYYSSCPSA